MLVGLCSPRTAPCTIVKQFIYFSFPPNLNIYHLEGMSEESSLDISAEDCDVNLSKDLALSASSCDEQVPATDNELVEAEDQMTSELTTGSGEPMVKTEDNVGVSDIEAKSPANDGTGYLNIYW